MHIRKIASKSNTIAAFVGVLSVFSGTAQAIDLEIQDDADYARFIDAIRAAEYVRSDVIVSNEPKPRVYAVLAGVMAYAERNPQASQAQIAQFMASFDTSLQAYAPSDPDLYEKDAFYAAVRFSIVDQAGLQGTDVSVGERALELLGIIVPDPDGFESIRRRMVRYEVALARPLDYRNEVFDLLVSGFFSVDPTGSEREGLASLLDSFFETEGFDPELGVVREDQTSVNAGLTILPTDYAGYQLAISVGSENMALRDAVTAQLDTVRTQIDAIVGTDPNIDDGSLDAALATAPGLSESIDLTMNDPLYVQQVLDDLRANLEATAEARAAASAATYLMLQSDFAEIEQYASYTQDFSSIVLQTNDDLSTLQSGLSIAGNLAIGIAGFYYGDPLTAAGGFLSAATSAIGLVNDLDGNPSVDEQVFDQVVALRQQVEQMRQEMNARFDRIDQQLNIMYNTMINGFNALGDEIDDIGTQVDELVREMASARSQLRRLEAALYGVAQDILLTDLTNEANVVLDYRDENGIDLPYSGGSPDFITASESFFTYATVTALSEAFVGSRSNPTVTVANAEEYFGDGPVSAYLNDLAVLPQELGQPPLVLSDLPGIEPWSQAAAAYAQLARENPWYFAYRYNRQLEDFNTDPMNESPPELDRIIQSGDQIVGFIDAIRETDDMGDSDLFATLIQNYKDAVAAVQIEIDAIITSELPDLFIGENGTVLDYWTQGAQLSMGEVATQLEEFEAVGNNELPILGDAQGYTMWADSDNEEEIAYLQMLHLIELDMSPNPSAFIPRVSHFRGQFVAGQGYLYEADFWIGEADWDIFFPTFKRIRYFAEREVVPGVYLPYTASTESTIANDFEDAWWGPFGPFFLRFAERATSDRSLPSPNEEFIGDNFRVTIHSVQNTPFEINGLTEDLHTYRTGIRNALQFALIDENSDLALAALELDRAEALIDAYVTVGMPKELDRSEVLRSALRAFPGTSELGLGSIDVITLIDAMDQQDSGNDWADPDFNVNNIEQILNSRIETVHDEIKRGLERPTQAPEYVGWVLAELDHLRLTAMDLAVDDSYIAQGNGILIVDQLEGVLMNDVAQAFRSISVDTGFDLEPEYIGPSNGSVEIASDGSFIYTPDAGFVGTDTFNYRSMTTIAGVPEPVYSEPATVVVVVEDGACNLADLTGDGQLNFFDVSAFLVAFKAEDSAADLDPDGLFNFFDVSAFLVAYSEGCP
jgi:hypothetical protein